MQYGPSAIFLAVKEKRNRAQRVVVVRAITDADDPTAAARRLRDALTG